MKTQKSFTLAIKDHLRLALYQTENGWDWYIYSDNRHPSLLKFLDYSTGYSRSAYAAIRNAFATSHLIAHS